MMRALVGLLVFSVVSVPPMSRADIRVFDVAWPPDTTALIRALGRPRIDRYGNLRWRHVEAFQEEGKVSSVVVTGGSWRSERGIGIGALRAEVAAAYGSPTWTDSTEDGYVILPDTAVERLGVSFKYRAGRVQSIAVGASPE
jgi:hypothetical protein